MKHNFHSHFLMSCWPASWYIRIIWTNKMHYFLSIYFNNKPLHVSSRLPVRHQEDQLCINSNWQAASQHIAGLYQSSLYWVNPPDDEQQACSKHVEAYYWNKLIENIASCWLILYGSFWLVFLLQMKRKICGNHSRRCTEIPEKGKMINLTSSGIFIVTCIRKICNFHSSHFRVKSVKGRQWTRYKYVDFRTATNVL